MDWNRIEGVERLFWAEPSFVQVLLPRFTVHKTASECLLTVEFSETHKAITHRLTKEKIRDTIEDFPKTAAKYQSIFDYLLLERSVGHLSYDDPDFRFRYASGGVLPILVKDTQEYYCLFLRDVFPIGWNIANGGCDSVTELLDPTVTIERELREELIILPLPRNKDGDRKPADGHTRDYVYKSADGRVINRPEFEIARELWNSFFSRMDFRKLGEEEVEVEWIEGPDRLAAVLVGQDGLPLVTNPTTRCFVNITAPDFSIELDKIAKIPIPNDVLLLDGEISNYKLLGRPVGLFPVQQTQERLKAGEKEFYPESVYYFGNPRPGNRDEMTKVVNSLHIPRLIKEGIRSQGHSSWLNMQENVFGMCPITSQMIRRHAAYTEIGKARATSVTVFISHSSKDAQFVDSLCVNLEASGAICFKAPDFLKAGENILRRIFDTIGKSDKLLLVISDDALHSRWVENEVNEAARLEAQLKRDILIPMRLDESVCSSDAAWAKWVRSRQILDFSGWHETGLYREAMNALLGALGMGPSCL